MNDSSGNMFKTCIKSFAATPVAIALPEERILSWDGMCMVMCPCGQGGTRNYCHKLLAFQKP